MSDKNRVTPQSSGTSRPSTVAAPARSRPSTSTSSSTSTASSISSLLASLQAARSNTTSRAPSSSAPSTSGTPTGSAGSSAAPTTAVAPANPLRESLRKTTTFGGDECIILHIGTLHARVGFAGESKPRHVFPITAPSFAKFEGNIEGSPSGRKASPLFPTSPPTPARHALLVRRISTLFREICLQRLLIDPKGKRVIIVEGSAWSVGIRRAFAEAILGGGQAASVSLIPHAIVSLLPYGLAAGLVIHLGSRESCITTVYDRRILWSQCRWHSHAGSDVRERLREGIKRWGRVVALGEGGDGAEERASLEREVGDEDVAGLDDQWTDDCVARCCFVGALPEWKRRHFNTNGRTATDIPPYPSTARDMLVPVPLPTENGGETFVRIPGFVRERAAECLFESAENGDPAYWPDYAVLPAPVAKNAGWEARRSAWYGGVAVEVAEVLLALPVDVRSVLASKIVVTGGLSHLPGIKGRILEEVRWTLEQDPKFAEISPVSKMLGCVHGPWDGGLVAWVGASLAGIVRAPSVCEVHKDKWEDGFPDVY